LVNILNELEFAITDARDAREGVCKRSGKAALSENKLIAAKRGTQMSLIAIVILNGLLGVSCGLLFSVQILIPLIAVAFGEMAILKVAGLWPSLFWSLSVLIVLLEVGYLIGASMATLWPSSVGGRVLRDFAKRDFARRGFIMPGYGRMSAIDQADMTQTSRPVA
jgi:hypothetical protein